MPAARAGTFLTGTRFVYGERAAIKFAAVKGGHRPAGLRAVIHCDKREAARFSGQPIHHQMDFADLAVLFEQILKIVLRGLKREISYVQFHCV